MLLILGGLSLFDSIDTEPTEIDNLSEISASDQDVKIIRKLDALMTSQRLYLDSDLTLSRLSRKLV